MRLNLLMMKKITLNKQTIVLISLIFIVGLVAGKLIFSKKGESTHGVSESHNHSKH